MELYINFNKKYLFFREEARAILRKILAKKSKAKNIYLDFSGVTFFSRSFVDELLNITKELSERGVSLKIQNISPSLKKMMKNIDQTKMEIQRVMADH